MPRNRRLPQVRLHASGNYLIQLSGRVIYLGKSEPQARSRADQLLAAWLARGRQPEPPAPVDERPKDLLVAELCADFIERGTDSFGVSETDYVRLVVRRLVAHSGSLPAIRFGPLALRAFMGALAEAGLSRVTVNGYAKRVRAIFQWGVAQELLPPSAHEALRAQKGLKRGEAKEGPPRRTPTDAEVEAVAAQLDPTLAAMVRVQSLTAMRAGELFALAPRHVDRSGPVWIYTVPQEADKMAYRGGAPRIVAIGPRAQELLRPFLALDPDKPVFSPRRSMEERWARERAARRSKVQPSQRDRSLENPTREYGDRYDTKAYNLALERGCRKAGVERFSSHGLRRCAAVRIRREAGLDAARAACGHRSPVVTEQFYAELDSALARDAAARLG